MKTQFAVLTAIVAGCISWAPVFAQSYFIAVDVPAELPTSTAPQDFSSHQMVRRNDGVFSAATAIAPSASISAAAMRNDGVFLMAPSSPATLGGTEFAPNDVFSFDGVNYTMVLNGAARGVPEYARVDGVFLHSSGDLLLGFDVPVNIGGTEYGRSDIVRVPGSGATSLFWSGSAAGVPDYANLLDAEIRNGDLYMVFDVPVNLGGTEYRPGQIVKWNSLAGFSLYASDVSWPEYAQARGFCLLPAPGAVPDGKTRLGTPLKIAAAAAGQITLSWGASCSMGASDFGIYEGTLGNFTSHTSKVCTTAGALTSTLTPASGSRYYLIVPRNGDTEGSYGFNSLGVERPAATGAGACAPQEAGVCP